jgi:hypothetical protein
MPTMNVQYVGTACTIVNTLFSASILLDILAITRSKSARAHSRLSTFALFCNSILWVIYADMRRDIFIAIPNGLAGVLSAIKLSLLLVYREPAHKDI